jgi:hypothetical protein
MEMHMDQAVIELIERHGVTERTRAFLNSDKLHFINGEFRAGAR